MAEDGSSAEIMDLSNSCPAFSVNDSSDGRMIPLCWLEDDFLMTYGLRRVEIGERIVSAVDTGVGTGG